MSDKKKSSSLPRDSKSPFGRAGKSKKDQNRRKTLDLDSSQTQNLPLNQIVKRTGWYNIELPEIVFATITEIESRGLKSPDIFKKPMPKSDVMVIIGQFDRLEEVDLSKSDIYLLAAVLKGSGHFLIKTSVLKFYYL